MSCSVQLYVQIPPNRERPSPVSGMSPGDMSTDIFLYLSHASFQNSYGWLVSYRKRLQGATVAWAPDWNEAESSMFIIPELRVQFPRFYS